MRLIICEKPKVAEKVANALSEGEFDMVRDKQVSYYKFTKEGMETYVVSAVGHIFTLAEKGKRSWLEYPIFDISWQPSFEVGTSSAYVKKYYDVIKKLSKNVKEVINSCDFDVEGSLIGYNIIRFACGFNPEKALRMKFSALTKKDLVDAFDNRFDLDLPNSYAGEARHMLDWYYGINLSRALMSALRKNKIRKVLSIGRVQGPALSVLVKREKEIQIFVPQDYWELWAKNDMLIYLHTKGKFFEEDEVKLILDKVSKGKAEITGLDTSKTIMKAPSPFDLTSLQIEAYGAFKITPSQILQLAQSLYEGSYISYPRTSSQQLPPQIDIKHILNELSKQSEYSDHVKKLLSENRIKPNNGKKEDPAHPAIHPTGLKPKDLSSREQKLYDLIVSRFLACLAPNAKRETWKANLVCENEKFVCKGTYTVEKGWLEYYKYSRIEEIPPPEISKGSVKAKFGTDKKQTKPPRRYTQATVISELEKRNLGTKATRATIVDTLFKREYVMGTSLEVKPLGITVHDALEPYCSEILDEQLTRQFEEEMEGIQNSKDYKVAAKKRDNIIKTGENTVRKISETFKKNEMSIGKKIAAAIREEILIGKCPNCGLSLMIRIARATKQQFIGCEGFPNCRTTYALPQNADIIPTGKVCESCGLPIVHVKPKSHKMSEYDFCLNPKCPAKIKAQEDKEKQMKETAQKQG